MFFLHTGRARTRTKRPSAFQPRMFSELFTGRCWFVALMLNWMSSSLWSVHIVLCVWSSTVPLRSEEEMLKFMGLMNSSWALDGHDIVTAFNLSGFQNIVDLGGKRSKSFMSPYTYTSVYFHSYLWQNIFVCLIHGLKIKILCLFVNLEIIKWQNI